MEPERDITDAELADLAQLADGTLSAERRTEVEARVAASPELTSMLERQTVALTALRGTDEIGAPARLRARIERPSRRRSKASWRAVLVPVTAAALALVLLLPSGGPSVAAAAELGQRPPTQPAPAQVAGTPQLLQAKVDGVPFPDYAAKFGWKPVGARRDEPSGRDATTVYYARSGQKIAYTIVSGDALDYPSHARIAKRAGVSYRSFRDDGRTVVTWERGGHTCVLSSNRVTRAELVALADWRGKGAIPF